MKLFKDEPGFSYYFLQKLMSRSPKDEEQERTRWHLRILYFVILLGMLLPLILYMIKY